MKKFANCSDFFIEIDYKLVEADKPIPTEIFQVRLSTYEFPLLLTNIVAHSIEIEMFHFGDENR